MSQLQCHTHSVTHTAVQSIFQEDDDLDDDYHLRDTLPARSQVSYVADLLLELRLCSIILTYLAGGGG